MCLGLIALEGQEIVATTADDLRGDLGSAGEGIQADQAAAQVQAIEQLGQRRQIASVRADGMLRQHQPVLDPNALTRCKGERPFWRSNYRRTVLPSIAICRGAP